jgi:hypothetical protein
VIFAYPLIRVGGAMSGIDKTRAKCLELRPAAALAVDLVSSPLAGAGAHDLTKCSRERRLVGKAGSECNLDKRELRGQHQIFRQIDPTLYQPAMRRDAECSAERAGKVADRHAALAGQGAQPNTSVET